MSNKTLYSQNLIALSSAGVTLKEFMALKADEAQKLIDTLGETVNIREPEDDTPTDQVYLNLDIVVNGRALRISGLRLDSDFVQYLDKEHTKENKTAVSLLQTINNKGVEYCNEHAEFRVTIQKQGESNHVVTDELF